MRGKKNEQIIGRERIVKRLGDQVVDECKRATSQHGSSSRVAAGRLPGYSNGFFFLFLFGVYWYA